MDASSKSPLILPSKRSISMSDLAIDWASSAACASPSMAEMTEPFSKRCGIETEAELSAVMQAGMTAAQGYMLGRPSVHPLDWSAWIIRETVRAPTST